MVVGREVLGKDQRWTSRRYWHVAPEGQKNLICPFHSRTYLMASQYSESYNLGIFCLHFLPHFFTPINGRENSPVQGVFVAKYASNLSAPRHSATRNTR